MQGKTIILLLILVGGLGALVWMQQDEAAADPDGFIDFPVFDGIATDDIQSIQIEQIERFWNLRLECDARGDWYMSDPIAYRADQGRVSLLLDQIRQLRGIEVVEVSDPKGIGFDPPRAVITVTERAPTGGEGRDSAQSASRSARSVTVEIGGIDLDGTTLYVRTGGRILRTLRNLHNSIAGSDQDFRSRRLTEVSPLERGIEIKRTGRFAEAGEDLSFEALAESSRWFATAPARVSLDPAAMHLLQQQILGTHITGFADDNPTDLSLYGLEDPRLRIEVGTARGNRIKLRFGQSVDYPDTWFAMRAGHPFVWKINAGDVAFFATPFEEFYDYAIYRANRSQIQSIELEAEGQALRIFRAGLDWYVTEALGIDDAELRPDQYTAADGGKVEDLLAALEHEELAVFLEKGTDFIPSDDWQRIEILTTDGRVLGGEIGALHTVAGSEEGRMFLRRDDELVSILSEELASRLRVGWDDLRSPVIHSLVEREQRSIRLARGAEELLYTLDLKANAWQVEGTHLESAAFSGVVDRLLSMRVRRWLKPTEIPSNTQDAISVGIQGTVGGWIRVRVLRSSDGQEFCEKDGLWGEIRPGLVDPIAELFGQ